MEWAILADLGEQERQQLLSVTRRRRFARGEVVFHRGDPADTLHLVAGGRFAVRIITPLGDTAVLTLAGRGEVFGEIALLGGGARTASVAALEPGETRSLHKLDFDGLVARHPQIYRVLAYALAARVNRLSELLVEALYVAADVRVLRRVHELTATYGDGDEATSVPLTQEELGGLAGTSRATVNRVLREAARRGEVRLHRGQTVVVDAPALARHARIEAR